MSAAALREYRRLVQRLLLERELAGVELSQDEEAERADELDLHWRQMNAGERAIIEEELASNGFAFPATADAPRSSNATWKRNAETALPPRPEGRGFRAGESMTKELVRAYRSGRISSPAEIDRAVQLADGPRRQRELAADWRRSSMRRSLDPSMLAWFETLSAAYLWPRNR